MYSDVLQRNGNCTAPSECIFVVRAKMVSPVVVSLLVILTDLLCVLSVLSVSSDSSASSALSV